MKTVKLYFTGFWEDFDNENNLFTRILRKRYDIVIDPVDPDFLICSPLGRPYEYMNYSCPRIMYTGEFISADFTAIDCFIGYDDIAFGDRAYRFPLFLYDVTQFTDKPLTEDEARDILKEKKYFCNYIFGHDTALGIREKILEALSSYKRVECAGRHRNNMPNNLTFNMATKLPFMRECKFTISAESVCYPGYTSEKIGHAFQTHTIPIYFGDPDIDKDFNERAFLNYSRFPNIDALVDKVIEIDQNDDLYIEMLCQHRYHIADYEEMKFIGLENFLFHIFDQDKEEAYRRPRYYRSYWHETYLKEYNHAVYTIPFRACRKLGCWESDF